ncbi:hypothetical protein TWF696_005427 [Orbilia brochopaga]|uniref:Uncharacterized protein n=1 Tax=Orbilia brochopaga TaxID=3140254 RepID=A0AAV9V153_9PEZI
MEPSRRLTRSQTAKLRASNNPTPDAHNLSQPLETEASTITTATATTTTTTETLKTPKKKKSTGNVKTEEASLAPTMSGQEPTTTPREDVPAPSSAAMGSPSSQSTGTTSTGTTRVQASTQPSMASSLPVPARRLPAAGLMLPPPAPLPRAGRPALQHHQLQPSTNLSAASASGPQTVGSFPLPAYPAGTELTDEDAPGEPEWWTLPVPAQPLDESSPTFFTDLLNASDEVLDATIAADRDLFPLAQREPETVTFDVSNLPPSPPRNWGSTAAAAASAQHDAELAAIYEHPDGPHIPFLTVEQLIERHDALRALEESRAATAKGKGKGKEKKKGKATGGARPKGAAADARSDEEDEGQAGPSTAAAGARGRRA